jgi:hypothetical protein
LITDMSFKTSQLESRRSARATGLGGTCRRWAQALCWSVICLLLTGSVAQAQAPVFEAKLLPQAGDGFGVGVALSGDTLLIGGTGGGVHIVDVYLRIGGVWTFQSTMVPNDGGQFGTSVAISGETVVVGAQNQSSAGLRAGAA